MRLYTVENLTPKHLRRGVQFLKCGDCGSLVFERAPHDAHHEIVDRLLTMLDNRPDAA